MAQSKTVTVTSLAVTSGGANASTIAYGATLTLTAHVSNGSAAVSPGQVKFCDASAAHCTDVHLLATAQLNSAGTAVFSFRPSAGSHSYKAVFAGTNTYAGSSSSVAPLTVAGSLKPIASAAVIAKTGNWDNYTLTGTVIEEGSAAPVTGSVSFLDTSNGNAVLASAALGTSTLGLNWSNSQTPPSGFRPDAIVEGDFNGDGIPDLAVANVSGGTISILLGNGDGSFTAAANPIVVSSPVAMAVADFNGDGKIDLAIANYSTSGTLTILLGNGDGTFTQTASSPAVGTYSGSIAVADYNGDGIPDMAVSSPFTGVISILLGKGDGTFTASQLTLASSGCISAIASGDFNGDGKPDLAVAGECEYDQGDSLIILTGNGDGSFTPGAAVQSANGASALVVADFNGDGKLDVALAIGGGSATVTILLGNGDGTFSLANLGPSMPTHGATIAYGDFNGDGIPDLALPNVYNNTVSIYLGNGDGTFTLASMTPPTGNEGSAITVADFDGDGLADIATANSFDNTVTVLLAEPEQTASATANVAISGVGQHMVEASYGGSSQYSALLSLPTPLWGEPPVTATTLAITSAGSPVTTVTSGSAVTLTATVLTGSIPLTVGQVNFCDTPAAACTGAHLVGSASLTSNGTAAFKFVPGPGQYSYKAELVENAFGAASSSTAATLTVGALPHAMATTTTTMATTGGTSNYTLTATVVGVGSSSPLSGSVSFLDTSYSNSAVATAALGASTPGLVWLNSSNIPFTNTGFLKIAAGDFNGDGIVDVAGVNTNSMTVTILLGNGDGTYQTVTGPTLTGYGLGIVAGDFNGDGKLDLAVSMTGTSYYAAGSVILLLGNGDGTFQVAPNTLPLGGAPTVFATADFNSDGKLDLLVNDSTGTRILLGNGDGTFRAASTTGLANTLAVADFNGDGIPDLLVQGSSLPGAVYLGNGDGSFRQATSAVSVAPGGSPGGSAAVGDFNGDGIPDLVAVNAYYSTPAVFLGNGDGTFTATSVIQNVSINEPGGIVVADFNQDGNLDLAITNGNSYIGNAMNPDLTLLLGNGDGTFTAAPGDTQLSSTWSILSADLNGHGVPDLIVGTSGGVSILLTEPSQTATATASGVNPPGPAPHLVDASYPGDSNYNSSVSSVTPLAVVVATPVFSLAPGTYTSSQTVAITSATPGATIYYMNGEGYPETWTVYTAPITLNTEGGFFIEAYATENGYEQSELASANYNLNLPPAPTPTITPGAGSYAGVQTVTISDAASSTLIYYTTNGAIPTTSSTLYTGPFTVSTSETVAAIANGGGYNISATASAQILIDSAASSFLYTVAGSVSWGYAGDGGLATTAMLNDPGMTLLDGSGNLYIADAGNNVVRKVAASTGIITTVAGTGAAGYGGDNGPASSAQLNWPAGIALDRSGNLYIADFYNGLVRKVTAATGIITTYAGNTTATALGDNGPATAAQLMDPAGLAFDSAGNLYIATLERIRMVNASTGTITTYAGAGAFAYTGDNGPATAANLEQPFGMAIDTAGNIYFSDLSAQVVRKITASTGVISTLAGNGPNNQQNSIGDGGEATEAVLYYPYGIAVDVSGNLYIADTNNSEIREVTASNGIIHRVIGSSTTSGCILLGGDGGPASSSGICSPRGVTVDTSGNLYIAETGRSVVRKMTAAALPPTAATASPVFTVAAGTYASPQTVIIASATPGAEIHITLDGSTPTTNGAGYHGAIAVTGSLTIQALAVAPGYLPSAPVTAAYTITTPPTAVIQTVAGTGVYGVTQPGATATSQPFSYLTGIALDAGGNLYIPDEYNNVVWEVSATTGTTSIVAGTPGSYQEGGNGGLATNAYLYGPTHVAFDAAGNLYIADSRAGTIRKVNVATGIISLYAGGNYYSTNYGDGGPATSANLESPQGLAVDSAGNLYIADEMNGRIRKVTPAGIISTVAGGGSTGLGDGGPATSASLFFPGDVAVDSTGNLYIADQYNARVRKVAAQTGIISTIAGNGSLGESGEGILATQAEVDPQALALDASDNVYIANWPNAVRKIDLATGLITTLAGSGYTGYNGDGGSATVSSLCEPDGLAAGKPGSIYIADSCNYRIRQVTYPGPTPTPVLSLATGTFVSAQTLTITDSIPTAAIYYTTDGTPPTTASTVYNGPITIATSEAIAAIAVASGDTVSAVATASYTINLPQNNPAPVVSSLSPALVDAGSGAFTLTANGSGFLSTSVVYWGTTALATQYVSSTQLTAQVPATDVASAGVSSITVQTPTPGGGASNIEQFEVDSAGSSAPSFTPSAATVSPGDSASFAVTLPSTATSVSASCLNLPAGAGCSYSAATGAVSITTTSATPTGTYQITVVFTETLPGAAWILLPFFLLPLAGARKRINLSGISRIALLALLLAVAVAAEGCGGGGSGGGTTPPINLTHQATHSGVITLTIH